MANTTRPSSSNTKHVGRKTAATSIGPSSCGRNSTASSDGMEHHHQQQQQQRAANSNNGNDMANASGTTTTTTTTTNITGGGHIILRAKYPLAVNDHVVSCNKGRQIVLQQQNGTRTGSVGEGLFSFHSVKHFGTGTPILLLSSTGSSLTTATHENRIGRHFIVQTTGPSNQNVASNAAVNVSNTLTCINPRTSAKLKVQMGQHQQQQQPQLSQNKMENDQLGLWVQTQDGASNRSNSQTPIGSDGEPIKLPENLESLPRSDHFPNQRHRWNTNEEIAGILISFDRHSEWQSKEVKIRPKSGSMLLYSRKKVRYRRDGYCWKKRKDGKTTREDHMKLKVQGTECIYGCYVHSAILPTFHRRCYWLLQNPDIVLVHYLNVPYPDDTKMAVITPNLALWTDKKEWTKDELVSQLKPMFFSEDEPDLNNELEISTAETVEAIVSQLMEKQRIARQAALVKQLECGCPDSTCADGKTCSHPMRRITSAATSKMTGTADSNGSGGSNRAGGGASGDISSAATGAIDGGVGGSGGRGGGTGGRPTSRSESSNNQVSSTTGSSPILSAQHQSTPTTLLHHHSSPRVYTRSDRVHQSNSNATQYVHISNNSNHNSSSNNSNNTPPLVLSLSQIQNGNGGLIILNSSKAGGSGDMVGGAGADGGVGGGLGAMAVAGFVCNGRKDDNYSSGSSSKDILSMQQNMLKQEAMDTTNQSSSLSLYTNLTTIISNNSTNDNQNGKQQSQTTILNHNDGFISRQRQYQSDAARSGTPSMSSKTTNINQDIISDTSPPNITFIDQQHKPSSTNQQLKLSPINIKLIPTDQLHTEQHTTQQQQPTTMNSQLLNHNHQHHFFDNPATLDLSQEDIQQTLSAYMPMAAMAAGDVLEVIESRGIGGSRRGGGDMLGGGSVMVIRGLGGDGSGSKIGGVAGGRQSHLVQHHQQVLSPEISSMDFIDPSDEVASSPNVIDDDVFVNLDAFDMLDEFPDLEILDPVGHSALLEANSCDHPPDQNDAHSASNPSPNNDTNALIICNMTTTVSSPSTDHHHQQHLHTSTAQNLTTQQHSNNTDLVSDHPASNDEAIVKITDYSPEWAYPDGGVKVLVTGPWHMNRSGGYSVLFDAFPVPTTLVQSGVLRCYCPAHEAGLATLQVACDGYVISNSVIFEYKLPQKEEHAIYALEPKVERSNDNLLKFTLLQRLEAMDERLQIKKEPVEDNDLVEDSILFSKPNLEDRLVTYCQRLTARLWRHGEELSVDWFASHRGMTLLHLAASLGYSRLVCAILHWRAENSSLLLETEVDALSQDEYGYTPLMWACVKGHTDTAVMLYKWNHTALNIPNHFGQSALDCAKMNGFHVLGKSLERLENKREKANQMLLLSTSTNGHSHGMTMSSHVNVLGCGGGQQNNKGAEDQKRQDAKVDGKPQESGGGEIGSGAKPSTVSSSSSGTISPAGSVTSLLSVASTSRSHDGVFLRPGAVTRSDSNAHPKYKSSLTLDLDSFTSSSSPSPTDIFHPSSSSSTKHLLSGAPNPLLSDGANSASFSSNQQNNNNSSSRDRSCFGQRLSKRTSFDSGIHLNQSAENVNPKTVRGPMAGGGPGKTGNGTGWSAGSLDKVTRFTRSMSLPLQQSTLAQEVEQSFNNYGDSSGLKKMDFALCEVVTMTERGESKRGGSPLIDVEAVSSDDEENDRINDHDVPVGDSDNMTTTGANVATANVTAVSGDQDVRVLTLAEQIIAAIPDRIKNESEDMLLDSPSSVAMLNCNDTLSDVLMEPLFDQSSSSFESSDVFELSDYNYRYYDVATPCSSLSPAPSSCLQSPRSFPLDSPSPPPTTADFCEFFQASGGIFEKDFSNLTLSDREQRELYEAAKIIQKAYRSYKGRQQQEQNKERAAAILIQNYYRRYKQYAYFKQMTHAAMVIQNGFRSYCEHKRFKKSKEAALCIQTYYRNYKEHGSSHCSSSRDNNLISENINCNSNGSTGLKRTYSQRRQHQAARKIQQFMRQSKNKLQRERAEREKQLDQLVDVLPLQKLPSPEDNST